MKSHGANIPFDDYRRERNQRRAQSGAPLRPIAKGQEVLREIEEAESRDIQEQRLTREVHDFFADATRTAASIVKRVTEVEVQSTKSRLTDEVEEFLRVTISRAQAFITMLQLVGTPEAERLVEAQMHNIVGTVLDEFRSEGTAQIEDKHFGQDPFDTSLAEVTPQKRATPPSGIAPAAGKPASPAGPTAADHRGIEEHLVAELNRNTRTPGPATGGKTPERAKGTNAGSDNPTADLLLSRIGDDPAKMKAALKAMVKNEVISREEAQQIWAEFRQKSSG